MGEILGEEVGVLVLGDVVGEIVGDTDGDDEIGDSVGDKEGAEIDGDILGERVGLDKEGEIVGLTDGVKVGLEKEGDDVGAQVYPRLQQVLAHRVFTQQLSAGLSPMFTIPSQRPVQTPSDKSAHANGLLVGG